MSIYVYNIYVYICIIFLCLYIYGSVNFVPCAQNASLVAPIGKSFADRQVVLPSFFFFFITLKPTVE